MSDTSRDMGIPRGPLTDGVFANAQVTVVNGVIVTVIAGAGAGGGGWPVYNVKSAPYNAAGDGVTDDTAAINAAIVAANAAGGGWVYFPKSAGAYMVNADFGAGQSVRLLSNVHLVGDPGTELKAITNALDNYAVIYGVTRDNIGVHGLTVTGERGTHTGVTGEFGMAIQLMDCTRVRIDNVLGRDGWGDGLYIGSLNAGADPCEDVVITRSVFRNNRRNNVSIVGCRGGLAQGCYFENANGTAPEAGIDIEPNFANECRDFKIVDCHSTGNDGYGFLVTTTAKNTQLEACTSRADEGAAFYLAGIDTVAVDCIASDMVSAVEGVFMVPANVQRARMLGCKVQDCDTGLGAFYLHATANQPEMTDCHVKNHNLGAAAHDVINVNAVAARVNGTRITNVNGISIVVGTAAPGCEVRQSFIQAGTIAGLYLQSQGMYDDNIVMDLTAVVGAFIRLLSNGAGSSVCRNFCKLSTPDTAILPLRCDVAPANAVGNIQSGMRNVNLRYVDSAPKIVVDANTTWEPERDDDLRYEAALTGNRTVTLSATRPYEGARGSCTRTGLGAFTLNVGGLKTIPSATAARVDWVYSGGAYKLAGYQLL